MMNILSLIIGSDNSIIVPERIRKDLKVEKAISGGEIAKVLFVHWPPNFDSFTNNFISVLIL